MDAILNSSGCEIPEVKPNLAKRDPSFEAFQELQVKGKGLCVTFKCLLQSLSVGGVEYPQSINKPGFDYFYININTDCQFYVALPRRSWEC